MSNILTGWREALVTLLDTDLQSGSFTVVSGKRDGLSRERKLACVFTPRFAPDRDLNYARPPMVIRAWIEKTKQPRQHEPMDPEPLEQLIIDLLELLQPVRTTLLADLYFEVADVEPDYEDWGVQVTLAAWILNPGTLPA